MYTIKYSTLSTTYWRCVNRNCYGTAKSNVNHDNALHKRKHNHDASLIDTLICKGKNEINKKSKSDCTPISQIYDKVRNDIKNVSKEAAALFPLLSSLKTSAYKARKQALPLAPKNLNDLKITGTWALTETGANFLLFDETINGERIIVFCTLENLANICKSKSLYMDGTFFACPLIFKQLYTIHTYFGDKLLPMAFCLLQSKCAATYHSVFRLLKDKAFNLLNLIISPDQIMTDYESSIIPVIRLEFPRTHHSGCYFHFTQAIFCSI